MHVSIVPSESSGVAPKKTLHKPGTGCPSSFRHDGTSLERTERQYQFQNAMPASPSSDSESSEIPPLPPAPPVPGRARVAVPAAFFSASNSLICETFPRAPMHRHVGSCRNARF